MVHREQVILPLRVDDVEHDEPLHLTHGLGTDKLLLLLVFLDQPFEDRVFHLHARELLDLGGPDPQAELAVDIGLEVRQVPGAGMGLGRAAEVHVGNQNAADDIEDLLALVVLLE